MTKQEAFEFAMAEIKTFNFPLKKCSLKLPAVYPKDTFYAFFEDEKTGRALCRTYMYNAGKVSFIEISNMTLLKMQNPVLIEAFLANGCYIYRKSLIQKRRSGFANDDGTIELFDDVLIQMPT